MSPFELVFDRLKTLIPALDVHPGKTVQAARLIQDWLSAGCDPELDILPAINKAYGRCPGKVTTPAYFDQAVRRAMQERTGSEEAKLRNADFRHQALKWKRDMGIHLTAQEERDLTSFEAGKPAASIRIQDGA